MKPRLSRHIAQFRRLIQPVPLCIVAVYLLGALVVPSNKFFFGWSSLLVLALFAATRSVELTLLYAYLPLSSLQIGQLYVFQAIPAYLLRSPLYPEGKRMFFTFSPFLALLYTSIFVTVLQILRYRTHLKLPLAMVFYLLAALCQLYSAMRSEFNPTLSVMHVLTTVGTLGWLITVRTGVMRAPAAVRRKVFYTLFFLLSGLVMFESMLILGQYFKRGTLGLLIEQTEVIPYFGAGADENALQFRPVGLTTHANVLADKHIAFLFALLLLGHTLTVDAATARRSMIRAATMLTVSLNILIIIISQSRSAYLALLVGIGFLGVLYRTVTLRVIGLARDQINRHKLLFLISLVALVFVVVDRSLHTLYSFGESGGVTTRELLVREAQELIVKFPLWGVGPGLFVQAAYQHNPWGVMKYFPEPVHNGFWLLAAENGLLASLLYLAAIASMLWRLFKGSGTLAYRNIIISGILATVVIMLLHPFVSVLPLSIVFLMLIPGVL